MSPAIRHNQPGARGARAPRRRPGMVENTPMLNILTHAILLLGMIILLFPMYLVFNASTLSQNRRRRYRDVSVAQDIFDHIVEQANVTEKEVSKEELQKAVEALEDE